MTANELNELLKSGKSGKSGLLLNVLPEEIHAARHIAGSSNACVYEMAFLDKVAELAPAKDLPIIVYGAGDDSLDSKVAQEKLLAAGYTQVATLPEGLAGWEAAGLRLAGDGHLPAALALDGIYKLDTVESVIRWTGRNLFNHHSGTVRLASGEIRMESGVLESARFVIDMNLIACEDLADSQWNAMLIRHLRDADFFEIDRFPTAEFIADRAEAIAACSDGTPNFLLKGRFTLRGMTKPLELPVVVASADGKRMTGQGQFELDRTEFGSIYGSGKFFRYLGKHVVNDHIHLHLKIHADLIAAE